MRSSATATSLYALATLLLLLPLVGCGDPAPKKEPTVKAEVTPLPKRRPTNLGLTQKQIFAKQCEKKGGLKSIREVPVYDYINHQNVFRGTEEKAVCGDEWCGGICWDDPRYWAKKSGPIDPKKVELAVKVSQLRSVPQSMATKVKGRAASETRDIEGDVLTEALSCAYKQLNEDEARAFFSKVLLPKNHIINVGDGKIDLGPAKSERRAFELNLNMPGEVDYRSTYKIDMDKVRQHALDSMKTASLYVCKEGKGKRRKGKVKIDDEG